MTVITELNIPDRTVTTADGRRLLGLELFDGRGLPTQGLDGAVRGSVGPPGGRVTFALPGYRREGLQ